MEHQEKRIAEFDLEKYLQESDDINILISTSYNKETCIGKYKCLLLYKSKYKMIEGIAENAPSPNYTMIMGLLDAVTHINAKNMNVCIISGIFVGFKAAQNNKGLYANKINQLTRIVEEQGNSISSIAITDGMKTIKNIMQEKA